MAPTSASTADSSLVRFLVATFGVSWSFGAIAGLGNLDLVDLPKWLVGVGNVGFLLGPACGALAARMGAADEPRAVVGDLVRPAEGRWYVIAVALGSGAALSVAIVMFATGAPATDLGSAADWLVVPLVLVGTTLAAILEEIGWRGTMLPAVRGRIGHRGAVVAVGLVWGVWHLPLLLTDTGVNSDVPLYAYPLLALGMSALLTWLYDAAGRSPTVSAAAHGSLNATMTPVLLASHRNGDLEHLYAVAVSMSLAAGVAVLARGTAPLDRRIP